jgi:hypothetical protein
MRYKVDVTRMIQAGRSVSDAAVTDKINVNVLVGRPVALEIVKEGRPVERQSVLLEVLQRESKNRGRCRRASVALRRASQPATQQCLFESNTSEGWAAEQLPVKCSRGRLRKGADL